jgi:rhamnogalacturonyl hydrolase YesR
MIHVHPFSGHRTKTRTLRRMLIALLAGATTALAIAAPGHAATAGTRAAQARPAPMAAAAAAPTDWSTAVVDSTTARYTPSTIGGWSYPVGLYLFGQYQVYLRTHNPKYLSYIRSYVDRFVDAQGGIDQSFSSLDSMQAGRLLVILHHETGQAKYAVAARRIRTRLDTYPRTSDGGFWHADSSSRAHQLWADGAYMVNPFLVEYGREFGDSAYTDAEAVKQLVVYGGHLQQPNGLLKHAFDESRTAHWADPSTGLAPEYWCRAVGWYAMASVDVLDATPLGQPQRGALLTSFRRLAAGLETYQDPVSGLWFQVMDKGSRSDDWTETSCSSMFTYALSRGVQQGYLDPHYAPVAAKGYRGVLARMSLGSDGRTDLTGISIGTNVGDYAYYVGRTRATNDLHGLGAFLIMNEQLRNGAARNAAATPVFNVRSYGAKGDGSTNDTPAINKAVTAAAAAGGGVVEFPSGRYKSKNTVHLKSHVTIQLDAGSTVLGSSADTYDKAESNPYDSYQDYGHSHFHDAMFYGDRLTDVAFTGSGTIDGAGNLITGNPGSGEADKIVSLTHCTDLTLSGITLRRGGHFAALINGCDHVTSDHLTIDTASDRDGWNVINATDVAITHADISANDDALVFKSDYALGAKLPNGHVTVTDSTLAARCCNALMFGSETCGDFTDYQFSDITVTGASKSGLGMVSMDGANISDVHYSDITMTGVHSPIMQKIGTRRRCGNSPGVGSISDITYRNITATGVDPAFTATLWGEAGAHHIDGVSFDHVDITVPGGSTAVSTAVPSNNATDYNPNSIGVRPAFGWYIHNADHVTFTDSSVRFAANDDRPAVIVNGGGPVSFDHFTEQRGSGSAFDTGFQSVDGYCQSNSATTTGAAPRVAASGSTQTCPARAPVPDLQDGPA